MLRKRSKIGCISGKKRNPTISFAFHSSTSLPLRGEDRLHLRKEKKSDDFFCFPFGLHYLCRKRSDDHEKNNYLSYQLPFVKLPRIHYHHLSDDHHGCLWRGAQATI